MERSDGQSGTRTSMSAPGGGGGRRSESPDLDLLGRPESSQPLTGNQPPDEDKQEETSEPAGAEGGGAVGGGGGEEEDIKEGGEEEEEEEEDNEWGFTKKQMEDLQEAFNVFDTNRDDTINPHKLFTVMRSLGLNPTEAEVQDLINAVDEDGNGTIEFDEFCEMMQKKIDLPDRDDELKEAFRVFDHDDDGGVSVEDMTSLFDALGMEFTVEEVKEMILAGDPSGQMQVNYDNFVRIANSESLLDTLD